MYPSDLEHQNLCFWKVVIGVHRNRLMELLGIGIEQLDKIAEESGWRREGEFYLIKQKEISCEKHSIASLSVIGHAK